LSHELYPQSTEPTSSANASGRIDATRISAGLLLETDSEAHMNTNAAEYWGGVAMIALGAVLLFAPVVFAFEFTLVVLLAATLGLAGGSILVALSRRGRAA